MINAEQRMAEPTCKRSIRDLAVSAERVRKSPGVQERDPFIQAGAAELFLLLTCVLGRLNGYVIFVIITV